MTEFDLHAALDRLAARICREIRSKCRRERAMKELRGHLEDAVEEVMRRGNPPEKDFADLEKHFNPHGIEVGYDGMEIYL